MLVTLCQGPIWSERPDGNAPVKLLDLDGCAGVRGRVNRKTPGSKTEPGHLTRQFDCERQKPTYLGLPWKNPFLLVASFEEHRSMAQRSARNLRTKS
jgi:hypothetical protein